MTSPLTQFLVRELRISERELSTFVATAPERYKVYHIPKRRGGVREIAHPASELKVAQRALIREFLCHLPVHPCATAYRPGSSIRANAERHSHNRPILKYDFKNFFPSITEHAWLAYCEKHDLFDRRDAVMAGRILFRRPKGGRILRLSIGAPSSPVLSNVLLNEFDREVYDRVSEHKITYTRYADDMTFSALRTWNLREVDKLLRSVLSGMTSPKLELNNSKTILVTPKYHRQVTGLVLTLDGRVSLGRTRKRNIRAAIHHFILKRLDLHEQVRLAGLLAFAKDVEPEFYTRMERVYSKEVVDQIKHSVRGYRRTRDAGR
jgi:hypothetical protein